MPLNDAADIHGFCSEKYAEVAQAFSENFLQRGEVGASACVIVDGETVVDLWGGQKEEGGDLWGEDTLAVGYSSTKAAPSLAMHLLASRGQLSLDDLVGKYWPAFAVADKSLITVRMLMNHTAGMVGLSEQISNVDLFDWDKMIALLEKERPLWVPGTRLGYAGMTYGYLVGELVRRITGTTIGAFVRSEIAQPLDADFWIGLPASEENRVARTVMRDWEWDDFDAEEVQFARSVSDGETIQVHSMNSFADYLYPGACDTPEFHAAENPSVGAVTNARGLARLYSPLARPSREVDFVTPAQHLQMVSTESAGVCATTFAKWRFSAGFEKTAPGTVALETMKSQTMSETAFGHTGFGGSIGFADPEARFSFGYVMNRHSHAAEPYVARSQALIDGVYRALGYSSKASGKWG